MNKTRSEIKTYIVDKLHQESRISLQTIQDILLEMVDNLTADADNSWVDGDGGEGSIQRSCAYASAEGNFSYAEGFQAKSTGDYSHAEGFQAKSTGDYSHAEGVSTIASGSVSHTEGFGTFTTGLCEHAEGKYNVSHESTVSSQQTLHSIGIGTITNKQNAFEVMQNGDIYVVGLGGYDGTNAGHHDVLTLQQILLNK